MEQRTTIERLAEDRNVWMATSRTEWSPREWCMS